MGDAAKIQAACRQPLRHGFAVPPPLAQGRLGRVPHPSAERHRTRTCRGGYHPPAGLRQGVCSTPVAARGFRMAPLCKGGCRRRRLGDCRVDRSVAAALKQTLRQALQPTIPPSRPYRPCHLPLHKGGLGAAEIRGRVPLIGAVFTRTSFARRRRAGRSGCCWGYPRGRGPSGR